MSLSSHTHVRAVLTSLRARGYRSLDDLTHAQQERLAGSLGVNMPELHRAAAEAETRAQAQPARRRSGPAPEATFADAPMLEDERVWGEVELVERRLFGDPQTGSRASRYLRVRDRLSELHRAGVEHPQAITPGEWDAIRRAERRLESVEQMYTRTAMAAAEAIESLSRQAAAELAAAKLGARR